MNIYTSIIAIIVGSYLLGSVPFGLILLRVFRQTDVRQTGSGNIGATNVARTAPGLGLVTLLLDAAKGYAAVAFTLLLATRQQIGNPYLLASLAGFVAIVGHIFPVWLKFKGGKGVAAGVGVFLAIAPKAVVAVLVLFLALVAAFRYVSLGSISAAAAFPIAAYFIYRQYPGTAVAIMAAASALIIVRHHENIRRLLAGTENRFQLKRG